MEINVKEMTMPRYMARFQCIGTRCELSCCGDYWGINVNKQAYQRIERVLTRNQQARTAFTEKVIRLHGDKAGKVNYAKFALDEQGNCGFLTGEKLCLLQRDYGEITLPLVCTTYPRYNYLINGRFERYGTLSCPEVARQCLLSDDGLVLESVAEAPTPGSYGNVRAYPKVDSFYQKYVDDIRSTMCGLLALPDYSFEQRMALTLFFAIRTQPYFNDQLTADPAARLGESIDYINQKKNQEEIIGLLPGIKFDYKPAVKYVLSIIYTSESSNVSGSQKHHFAKKMREAMGLASEMPMDAALATAGQLYQKQKQALVEQYSETLDQYFTRYAFNFWLSNPYAISSDLVVHMRRLLLRFMTIKMCFFCHPDMVRLVESGEIANRQQAVDAAFIEVVVALGRTFDHNDALQKKLEDAMDKSNLGLPMLASFLKL